MAKIIFFLVSLFLQGALGELVCDKLPIEKCAFSISSSRKRCVLENYATNGTFYHQCITSEVVVNCMPEWIESEKCIEACGVDRYSIGISSDSLMESEFTAKLCAPACYQNCPSIVDLYYNLALGEGAFLPDLCDAKSNPRRMMSRIASSGAAPKTSTVSANTVIVPVSASATAPTSFLLSDEETDSLSSAPAPV